MILEIPDDLQNLTFSKANRSIEIKKLTLVQFVALFLLPAHDCAQLHGGREGRQQDLCVRWQIRIQAVGAHLPNGCFWAIELTIWLFYSTNISKSTIKKIRM